MLWKIIRLVFGFVCGYLAVNWLPLTIPWATDKFLGEFILNPLEFLAGAITLVMRMYTIGGLIRNGMIAVIKTLKGKKKRVF
jgi:hypothetical protein